MESQGVGPFVGNNTENRCFVDIAFVKLLLPATRQFVTQQLFVLLEERSRAGARHDEVLPGLAPKNLFECGDVRKFLNIMLNVHGCFTAQQQNLAYQLKHNRELFAKEELIPDSVKTAVYQDVKALLETFPNTEEDLENLEAVWAYGAGYFLKPAKDDDEKDKEIENLRKQVEDIQFQGGAGEAETDSSAPSSTSDEFYYSDDEEADLVRQRPVSEPYSLFSAGHGFTFHQLSPQQELKRNEQQQQQPGPFSLYPAIQELVGDRDTSLAILRVLQRLLPSGQLASLLQQPQQLRARVQEALEVLSAQTLGSHSALQYVDNSKTELTTIKQSAQATAKKSPQPPRSSAPEAPKSYSIAAARSPAADSWTTLPPKEKKKKEKSPAVVVTAPTTATATSVGYKLNYMAPSPDPRFRADTQVMMGPIPGSLSHEEAYVEMRSIFAARGRVKFQYLSPSFVEREAGRAVKYGYVVFEERVDAQRVIKEGAVVLMKKYKIKLAKMCQ